MNFKKALNILFSNYYRSRVQRMVTHDISATNITNTSTSTNPALKMYLYACKLLDVLLAMPYSEFYHFQL